MAGTALDLWRDVTSRLATHPTLLVYGSQPPDAESRDAPYVVVDGDPGSVTSDRAAGTMSTAIHRVSVRCCGSTVEQCLWAVQQVRDQMRDWRPWASLRWSRVWEEDAGPLIRDDSVPTDIRYSATLGYRVDD